MTNNTTSEGRVMTGEFQGKRFEIGSVHISNETPKDIYSEPIFTILGRIPQFDANAGKLVYLTTIYKCGRKAAKFCDNLNAKE